MTQTVEANQVVVDRSSCAEIAGAEIVDLDALTVTVVRREGDEEKRVTLHFPGGVAIVRRR
jgi:hypothetical protein